jgi:aspartokinase
MELPATTSLSYQKNKTLIIFEINHHLPFTSSSESLKRFGYEPLHQLVTRDSKTYVVFVLKSSNVVGSELVLFNQERGQLNLQGIKIENRITSTSAIGLGSKKYSHLSKVFVKSCIVPVTNSSSEVRVTFYIRDKDFPEVMRGFVSLEGSRRCG